MNENLVRNLCGIVCPGIEPICPEQGHPICKKLIQLKQAFLSNDYVKQELTFKNEAELAKEMEDYLESLGVGYNDLAMHNLATHIIGRYGTTWQPPQQPDKDLEKKIDVVLCEICCEVVRSVHEGFGHKYTNTQKCTRDCDELPQYRAQILALFPSIPRGEAEGEVIDACLGCEHEFKEPLCTEAEKANCRSRDLVKAQFNRMVAKGWVKLPSIQGLELTFVLEQEVDAAFESLLKHPMSMPQIKKNTVESLLGVIASGINVEGKEKA